MAKRIEMALYTDKGAVDEKNQDRVLFQDAVYEEGLYQGDTIFPCMESEGMLLEREPPVVLQSIWRPASKVSGRPKKILPLFWRRRL